MKNDITVKIGTCSACIALLPSQQHEPLLMDRARYPMEKVSVDLFELAAIAYLVVVDRYSGYPFVARLRTTTTAAVCLVLLRWFCEVGFPRVLKSDNGPQFRGPFKDWCDEYSVEHVTSSPYNAQSNGLAEAAVKGMKHLLVKVGANVSGPEFRLALLAWRTAPRADGYSPSFAFYGRHLRTQLPAARGPMVPLATPVGDAATDFEGVRDRGATRAAVLAGGRDLPPLQVGDKVHFQKTDEGHWHEHGRVTEILSGRSYMVATPGGDFRKNRRHLRRAVLGTALPAAPLPAAPLAAALPPADAPPTARPLVASWRGSRAAAAPPTVRRSRRHLHVTFARQ
jgi:transposase InsO family protein